MCVYTYIYIYIYIYTHTWRGSLESSGEAEPLGDFGRRDLSDTVRL